MADHPQLDNSLVIDYLTLRKAIGILGLALPFLLSIGALIIFERLSAIELFAYVVGLMSGPEYFPS